MESRSPTRTLLALAAGIGSGLLLACGDVLASGLTRIPAGLIGASFLGGALAGLLAGLLAALVRLPGGAPALVLAGGIALEGLATVSKELHGAARPLLALLVLLAALAVPFLARRERRGAWPGALLSLSAGAGLAAHTLDDPRLRLLGLALPLLWLGFAGARRLRRLGLILLAAGFALASRRDAPAPQRTLPAAVAEPGARPSVVLLVIDTLRADALPADGTLRAFAREGLEFTQCVSAAPWTLPAVGSLLTGLVPSQHGAVHAAAPLPEDVTTLAEHLHAQGYATGAFTGGAFVGSAHRLDQGFERFESGRERRFPPFGPHLPLVWRVAKNRYLPLSWLVGAVDEYRGLAGGLEAACAWAEEVGPRPRFLFLHTYQVHDYYLYDPDTDDAVRAAQAAPSARFAGRSSVHPSELQDASAADLAYFRALYDGRVRAIERLFPELVRRLETLLGEDVLWVVTADHGEGFDAEHGRVHHGGRLHEDLLRVPLLMRARGRLPAGRVVAEMVRSVDVLPTVLDLLALPIPAGLAGESLLPALRGERPFPSGAFAEERAHGYDLRALRRAGWKWIEGPSGRELYHLSEDPLELRPRSEEPPAELRAQWHSFGEVHPPRPSGEIELDAATLAHLRALGYVD